ncbi:hypothetical protein D3C74_349840 [compost metagenome]
MQPWEQGIPGISNPFFPFQGGAVQFSLQLCQLLFLACNFFIQLAFAVNRLLLVFIVLFLFLGPFIPLTQCCRFLVLFRFAGFTFGDFPIYHTYCSCVFTYFCVKFTQACAQLVLQAIQSFQLALEVNRMLILEQALILLPCGFQLGQISLRILQLRFLLLESCRDPLLPLQKKVRLQHHLRALSAQQQKRLLRRLRHLLADEDRDY